MTTNNVQTSYGSGPSIAYAGQLADEGERRVESASAESEIAAGLVCVRGATARSCKPPLAATADADGIIATLGSTAGIQTLSGASLDGVVGAGAMVPTRNVTLTLSSHADWDATTAVVTGVDVDGNVITENLSIPNGGNATVTGATLFRKVTSLVIPAQSGTGGTATMGFGSLIGSLKGQVLGATMYDASKKPGAYVQYESVPVVRQGRVYMLTETAMAAGDPIFVRCHADGAEVLGAVRSTPDGNDCVRLEGARCAQAASAAALAVVEFNLPTS